MARSSVAVLLTAAAAGCANSVVTSSGSGTTGAGASTSSSSTGTGGSGGAGGAPLSQTCTLETLASALKYPSEIHAGSDAVYVLVNDSGSEDLLRVPFTGGASPTIVTDTSGASVGESRIVTADAAHIAWVDVNGGVDVMPAGGGPTTVLAPPSTATLSHLTLSADALYAATDDGSILRLPLTGAGAQKVFVGPPDSRVQAIGVDGATLFFAALQANDPLWNNNVLSIPNLGGPTTSLAHFRGAGASIALSAGKLFVANRGSVFGGPGGTGGVLQATLDGSAPPATLAWGLGTGADAVAVDTTGVYWSGGEIAFGAMAPAIWPGTISRISANGVQETIVSSVVADSIVLCGDGVCWPDAQAGTVTRAHCSAIVPVLGVGPAPAPACATYCTAMGGCSRVACLETCAHLIASPCESQGQTLVACLASHLDPLTCEASGCDAQSSALAACRAAPAPAKPFQDGGGDANATASYCQASEKGPAGVELDVCDGNASSSSCTCYVDATPIGTCSAPMPPTPTMLPCYNTPCCNGLLGNVKG